jgi:hypothetical protein
MHFLDQSRSLGRCPNLKQAYKQRAKKERGYIMEKHQLLLLDVSGACMYDPNDADLGSS